MSSWRTRCRVIALSSCATLALTVSVVTADDASDGRWRADYNERVLPVLKQFCHSCHKPGGSVADFDLERFHNGDEAFASLDLWEQVGARVRLNEMPPSGSPGLNDDQKALLMGWLDSIPKPAHTDCRQIATDETQAWYKGYVLSRRLTRYEYASCMRDLFGVELDAGADLPADGAGGEGFDTTGDTLFTSAIHAEKYLAIADRVVEKLLSDKAAPDLSNELLAVRLNLLEQISRSGTAQRAVAQEFIRAFAKKAWRRPLADDEITRLLALYDSSRKRKDNQLNGVRQMLKAVLMSPHFLFVVETESGSGGVERISAYQLATRLSLFLWSSLPDAELFAAAGDESLFKPEVLKQHVQRMLKDPKSRALGENFGLQWLNLVNFGGSVRPDSGKFPEFNDELKVAMREEVIRFVQGVFQDERDVFELLNSNYTFANARLAQHYGIPATFNVGENGWARVTLPGEGPGSERGGLVSMAAVLTSTSYPRRTSPVLRGRWVLEEILGSKVPPPPPNVPALEETHAGGEKLSLRQRLEHHRTKPECAACHDRMDPLGFGLENFDAIGRFRTEDAGQPIDSSGKLPSGEQFVGPQAMKQVLQNRRGEFQYWLTRRLVGYAYGRELNKFDDCVMKDAIEYSNKNGSKANLLLESIALSYPFQHRFYRRKGH